MMKRKLHPISGYVNFFIADEVKKLNPKTILDMGGTWKFKSLIDCPVTNANIRNGIDATKLPYEDKSFDITISCATLEHVKNQKAFLNEAIRVARIASIHWFPFGIGAKKIEAFKKSIGHRHPCIIPTGGLIDKVLSNKNILNATQTPLISCPEHLLLLLDKKPKLNNKKVYEYVKKNRNLFYGLFLKILL